MRAIDLFAGAGGFTAGAREAGIEVVWAANHWRAAVETHSHNHPETEHSCQDLLQADWDQVPDHDLLLASPACQGHSSAGRAARQTRAKAKHDADRNTAWAVIGCADARLPEVILVENVPEFLRWDMFPAWKLALECVGYVVTTHVFDAAEFGVPQNRRRVYITARMGRALHLESPGLSPLSFRSFLERRGDGWAPVSSKSPGVQARVRRGQERGLTRFLTQHVTNHPGRPLDRPIGTITTKQQWALVNGDDMRMLTVPELRRAMGFPEDYVLPETKQVAGRMLGNAVCPPVACELLNQVKVAN